MSDPTSPEHIDPSLPEVVRKFLASGKRLEEIRLDANGHWTHEGDTFENPRIINLFSRSIARTTGGTWVLSIPPFTYPIEVEDAPFFIEHITRQGEQTTLTLSDGTTEQLDPTTLRYEAGGKLYCEVKGGDFKARFKRPPYYTLLDGADVRDTDDHVVLTLGGQTIDLGPIQEE